MDELKQYKIPDTRKRIEDAATKLGLDALVLIRECGVTTALAEMLERELKGVSHG